MLAMTRAADWRTGPWAPPGQSRSARASWPRPLRRRLCWSWGEIAVIAALAITILVKIGPAHYSVAVLSPASSPNQRLTDLTDAMIYGFTAFAGFEAAAALGEEATNARRSVPVSIVAVVVGAVEH